MLGYTKYLFNHILILITAMGFLMGGHWLWLGYVTTLLVLLLGDSLLGDHSKETPKYRFPYLFTLIGYSYLPMIYLLALIFVWAVAPADVLGLSQVLGQVTGQDVLAAKANTGFFDCLGAMLGLGILMGMVCTGLGHEFTHRTFDPVSMFAGRWFFGLSGGVPYEVEHVFGHHHTVGEDHDASLSLREDNFYIFFVKASYNQIVYAIGVERERLKKRRKSLFSFDNKLLRSIFRVLLLWAVVFCIGGIVPVVLLALAQFYCKLVSESGGYMYHHGLVRDCKFPPAMRHSWSSNKVMSSLVSYNVTKHALHHEHPQRPYQDLGYADPEQTPVLKHGAITTSFAAFVPPVWRKIMAPQILAWDSKFATDEEKEIAARQNRESQYRVYRDAAQTSGRMDTVSC